LQLLEHLFPDLATALHDVPPDGSARQLVRLGLQGTDERVRAEKSVTPTFLFAILMWPAVQRAYAKLAQGNDGDPQQLLSACDHVTARQQARVAIPKRFTLPLRELVGLQPRFERREGRRALRLLNHPRFRAAYDFLVLRAAAGEIDPELAKWWTDIQSASADERVERVESLGPGPRAGAEGPRRRRRRRRRRPPASS
jgi:poly(A) polymerase